ncbi:hypothetical protein L0P85_03710 [Terrisporobacter glycolicus]|nr:hypothetical protein L0P85_03710 [Terrisporobacter glycolicus]
MKQYKIGNVVFNINSIIDENQNYKIDIFENIHMEEEDVAYNIIYLDKFPNNIETQIYKSVNYIVTKDHVTNKFIRMYTTFENDCYAKLVCINEKTYNLYALNNYKYKISTKLRLFNHLALEKVFIKYNSFILHSSFIIDDNKAILFSAPSGTGKSTQASMWNKYRNSSIINGDRSLIKKEEGSWISYGLPFSGSSEYCKNKRAKIKAIVLLEQSKINSIELCNKSYAIKQLFGEISVNSWDIDFIDKILGLLDDLTNKVPVFKLACRVDEDAINLLESEIEKTGDIS